MISIFPTFLSEIYFFAKMNMNLFHCYIDFNNCQMEHVMNSKTANENSIDFWYDFSLSLSLMVIATTENIK